MAIIIGSAWLLVAVTTFATTHYVAVNSANPVTPYTSWETASGSIQNAVDAAKNGDTVLIGDGTYDITSEIKIDKELSVRSLNGRDVTIVDANRTCRGFFLDVNSGPITLEGLTVREGYADENHPNAGGIRALGSTSVLISNCSILNNKAKVHGGGICVGAIGGSSSVSITVMDCVIGGNECGGAGGGLMVSARGGSAIISRCRVFDNSACRAGGVFLGPNAVMFDSVIYGNKTLQYGGGGVQGSGEDSDRLINCTITENQSNTTGGGVITSYVLNSIVYNNQASENNNLGLDCVASNSCARNPPNGNGNTERDPLFINASKRDFRLRPDSPCIDTGSNIYTNSPIDLAGNSRAADGDRDGNPVVDMGAYEFQCLEVEIDIKPGSQSKSINLKAGGLLPVAILTTDSFDASTVNPASVRFAAAPPVRRMLRDVDADGDADLVLAFNRRKLKLDKNSTRAILIGETKDGQLLVGYGRIQAVSLP